MYLGLRKEGSAGAGVDEELKTCIGVKQKESLVDMETTTGGGDLRVCFLTIHMDGGISLQ